MKIFSAPAFAIIFSALVALAAGSPAHAGDDSPSVQWLDPTVDSNLAVEGAAWFSSNHLFRRLPVDSENKEFRAEVNALADNTAGMQIRFRTNSPFVRVRVQLTGASNMWHMPPSGQSGVDLYDNVTGRLRFCGAARVNPGEDHYEAELCTWPSTDGPRDWKDVTLNLPLYNGVKTFEIGVAETAEIARPTKHRTSGRVAIYGTSITQGAATSRPGLGWTNQLSRQIDQEVINLGFSGNGMGEPALAKRIAELTELKLVVLDYEANAQDEGVRKTMEPFIALIRARYPKVPIVIVSQIPWVWQIRSTGYAEGKAATRKFQRALADKLRRAGDSNIHFIDGYGLMPLDHFEDGLVDGVHPNDLGMSWISENMLAQLRKLHLVSE